ncbi:MAG: hypothetical protein WD294_15525 [Phycisphaeraceae bacterium]
MAEHVAIVDRRYVKAILSGDKRVECRLTQTARPPFGCITPGDRLYLKQSSGPFFAEATAGAVYMADKLTPAAIDAIRDQHDEAIQGEATFWEQRRKKARHVTLIWLRNVQPIDEGPTYRKRHMVAWYVLEDDKP